MKLKKTFFSMILVCAADRSYADAQLFEMDLEQLMQVEVISIAKKPQSVHETAAAIHVISQKDIKRSGATSLPEVLRGVPGLHVAQISANNWAISIRGFNDRFANKLLVLVDGRSVYTPLFAGVYWNMQDMLLEDIERIEVVRGAGGTLWGANAVNGVINIITKHADKTQGAQLSFTGGSQDLIANARYGGKLNDDTFYRIYAQGRRADNNERGGGVQANDRWKNVQAGFRLDSKTDVNNDWLVEGSYNNGDGDQTTTSTSLIPPSVTIIEDEVDYQSGNLLVRWNQRIDDDQRLQVQGYYDYFERTAVDTKLLVHTMDIDMQHQIKLFDDHDFIWGLGYRGVYDELESNFTISFDPKFRYASTFSGFIQDEYRINDVLRLTVGSKFEHNDYTGFEYQPSARLLWKVNSQHSLWTSVSRSVRVPSRSHQDMRINFLAIPGRGRFAPPALFSIIGNKDLKSENVYSAELGYRALFSSKFSLDVAGFLNYYDDLNSQEQSVGVELQPLPPHLLIASTLSNQMTAIAYGTEIQAKWQPFDFWQLTANYSWLKLDAQYRANSTGSIGRIKRLENADPQHQASLRSTWQLPLDLELNSAVYYTDNISARGVNSYTRLDLSMSWKPNDTFELSVAGQNLLDGAHKEYNASDVLYSEVPRSVYAKIITRF